jgi:transcriptional regulator with XRE-family HTH domain
MQSTVKQFGKKVREIRLQKKMSQGDVAKILSVHRSYISGIERGMRNPSLMTIEKIAKALGISKENLLKF